MKALHHMLSNVLPLFKPKFTKIQAKEQWNKMKGSARQLRTDYHYPGRDHKTLTDLEIQEMFNK